MINELIYSHKKNLEKKDFDFLERIYVNGIDIYEKRILQYKFTNFDNVLDAGCGFGQWSIPLSKYNNNVHSIDICNKRSSFTHDLAKKLNINNIRVSTQSINNTNFKDNSFDAIFCYGVFFLTEWEKTLLEFKRILKLNGKLYLNANGKGWYLNLIISQHNKIGSYDPRNYAINSFINTERYKNNKSLYEEGLDVIIEKNELLEALKSQGFSEIQVADEGALNAKESVSFFKGEYHGETGVYEVISNKSKN